MKSLFLISLAMLLPTAVYAQGQTGEVVDSNQAPVLSRSQVPPHFYPNHQMNDAWSAIQDKFVQINAAKNTGIGLESSFFQQLEQEFSQAFPYLPNDSGFKVTFEQCRLLTTKLAAQYSRDDFSQFIQGCYKPLQRDMSTMESKYTIKPAISVKPATGPAPLTVTFDADGSLDPSIATIPTANFFRYYKDIYGIDQQIGQGPVVTYTFDEPGNYVVYLTVRSANQSTQGILDGHTTTTVNVDPQAATVVLFANGRKMFDKDVTKVGTVEAQQGITFDASGTLPKGGREILSHSREVKSEGRSIYTKRELEGAPGSITVQFPEEGQFNVALTVVDNQNNTLTKFYKLAVSDPLAIIKHSPEEGSTSTTFKFDATSSYSLVSKIRQYTWEIINPDGQKIDTLQSRSITKKFDYPGPYKIQLTVEDEQGRKNTESLSLMVESTPPLAQFTIEEADDREFPSQFRLDAGSSTDTDVLGADDVLTYQWRFSPEQYVTINESIDDGRRVLVSFEEKGDYSIKLTTNDKYGKLDQIEKKISVESTIRPQLYISPVATFWGAAVRMLAQTNKDAVFYKRDMGDGETRETATPALAHVYDKVGVYTVTLTVHTEDSEYNTITKQVFIGEKDVPIVAYEVKDRANRVLKQNDSCLVDGVEYPAYNIQRGKKFTIDVSKSVNTKGEKKGLQLYFQPEQDDIYKNANFNYSFVDLGCRYIDIKSDDTIATAVSTERVWFKVVNALPELKNIILQFPQYGHSVGVDLTLQKTTQQQSSFEATDFSNLIVKVSAQGGIDTDGVIAFYKWSYFNKDNPSRILETKITPVNIPETYFTLQKIPGEYEFSVTLVDNDGGEVRSQDIIGHGPTVFFPPDSKNLDIPIVTLRQSTASAKVGQEVSFDVVAKILNDRPDFATNKSVKYDFDGDGEFDTSATKEMTATHVFTKPGTYTPMVKVLYRGIPGTARGESITVEEGLVPRVIVESYGQTMIAREVSLGNLTKSMFCADIARCAVDQQVNHEWLFATSGEQNLTWMYRYDKPGVYVREVDVTDDFGNQSVKTGSMTVVADQEEKTPFASIPRAQHEPTQSLITVGKQLDNMVVWFLPSGGSDQCFVDANIIEDTSGDGDPSNDQDVLCDTAVYYRYEPLEDSVTARRYQGIGTGGVQRDIIVNFLDSRVTLDESYQQTYTEITNLIPLLDTTDTDITYLKQLLLTLRRNLDDHTARSASIVAVSEHVQKITDKLSEKELSRINVIVYSLSDQDISAALGGNAYDQAKQEILLLTPSQLKSDIQRHFAAIDAASGQRDSIKENLQNIINTLRSHQGSESHHIDPLDIDMIVMPNICKIMVFFSIPSDVCNDKQVTTTATNTGANVPVSGPVVQQSGSLVKKIFKWILYVVGFLVLVLGAIFMFYLFKARAKSKKVNKE